jgi:hypothetical protein
VNAISRRSFEGILSAKTRTSFYSATRAQSTALEDWRPPSSQPRQRARPTKFPEEVTRNVRWTTGQSSEVAWGISWDCGGVSSSPGHRRPPATVAAVALRPEDRLTRQQCNRPLLECFRQYSSGRSRLGPVLHPPPLADLSRRISLALIPPFQRLPPHRDVSRRPLPFLLLAPNPSSPVRFSR